MATPSQITAAHGWLNENGYFRTIASGVGRFLRGESGTAADGQWENPVSGRKYLRDDGDFQVATFP